VDGEFPWVLFAALLIWVFNLLRGNKGTRAERPRLPGVPPRQAPRQADPPRARDATQAEGGQLEGLLRALEQRLDPTAAEPTRPRAGGTAQGPRGRAATVKLPSADELEERESLETEPVVESLEREVQRPERVTRDWLAQAEARERARVAQVEARDNERHKPRHAAFDKRIREAPAVPPVARQLTPAEIRQAFIWAEILGRPKGEM
jgi:hypothetical protein